MVHAYERTDSDAGAHEGHQPRAVLSPRIKYLYHAQQVYNLLCYKILQKKTGQGFQNEAILLLNHRLEENHRKSH